MTTLEYFSLWYFEQRRKSAPCSNACDSPQRFHHPHPHPRGRSRTQCPSFTSISIGSTIRLVLVFRLHGPQSGHFWLEAESPTRAYRLRLPRLPAPFHHSCSCRHTRTKGGSTPLDLASACHNVASLVADCAMELNPDHKPI